MGFSRWRFDSWSTCGSAACGSSGEKNRERDLCHTPIVNDSHIREMLKAEALAQVISVTFWLPRDEVSILPYAWAIADTLETSVEASSVLSGPPQSCIHIFS